MITRDKSTIIIEVTYSIHSSKRQRQHDYDGVDLTRASLSSCQSLSGVEGLLISIIETFKCDSLEAKTFEHS